MYQDLVSYWNNMVVGDAVMGYGTNSLELHAAGLFILWQYRLGKASVSSSHVRPMRIVTSYVVENKPMCQRNTEDAG